MALIRMGYEVLRDLDIPRSVVRDYRANDDTVLVDHRRIRRHLRILQRDKPKKPAEIVAWWTRKMRRYARLAA